MASRYRFKIIFLRQIVFGVSYVYKTLHIGFLCFNLQIDCSKGDIAFFNYENLWKK